MATQEQAKMETLICSVLNLYGAGRGSRRVEPIQISAPECKLAINHLIRHYGFYFLHPSPNAVSHAAIDEGDKKKKTVDHVVPLKEIMADLMGYVVERGTINGSYLREYLTENLLTCTITKIEDKFLRDNKLHEALPKAARTKTGKIKNQWARYHKTNGANIPYKLQDPFAGKRKRVKDCVEQEV